MRSLRSGIAYGLAFKATYLFLQFATAVVLARWLGPAGYGLVAFGMAFAALCAPLLSMGFPQLYLRDAAVNSSVWIKKDIGNRSLLATRIVLIGGAGLITSVALVGSLASEEIGREKSVALLFGAIMALPLAIIPVNSGLMRGLGYLNKSLAVEHLVRPVVLLAGVAACFSLAGPASFVHALSIAVGASFAASLVSLWLIKVVVDNCQNESSHLPPLRSSEIMRAAAPFLALTVAQAANSHISVLMSGIALPNDEVGSFRAAQQIAEAAAIIFVVVGLVVAPLIAKKAKHSRGQVLTLISRWHLRMFLLFSAPAVAIFLLSDEIIRIMFGETFESSAHLLKVLIVGKLLYATVALSGVALAMIGLAKSAARITILWAFAGGVLHYFVATRYGITGTAVVAGMLPLCVNICYWLSVWKWTHAYRGTV